MYMECYRTIFLSGTEGGEVLYVGTVIHAPLYVLPFEHQPVKLKGFKYHITLIRNFSNMQLLPLESH